MVDLLTSRLEYIKQKGFSPKVIYDVGAFRGDWAQAVKAIFPDAQVHSFEANESRRAELTAKADVVHIGVVGDENKQVPFYSIENTGDSVLKEATQWYNGVEPKMLQMRTIDSMSLPSPQLCKLDLQGWELHALAGAKATLANTEVIIMELKILEYNAGAPTFLQSVTAMDKLDYIPLDVTELHYLPSGELNEIDIVFVKKGSGLLRKGQLV